MSGDQPIALESGELTHFGVPRFDSLDWARDDITHALAAATAALEEADFNAACEHTHQAARALEVVGLEADAHLLGATADLLLALAHQELDATPDHTQLARHSLDALAAAQRARGAGEPGQAWAPLQWWPLYQQIQTVRGQTARPGDLFYPDLNRRPAHLQTPPLVLDESVQNQLALFEHRRFERGLQAWLREPAQPAGAQDMRRAAQAIERSQRLPAARAFWWAATALCDALQAPTVSPTPELRQVMHSLERQIRHLLAGALRVPDALMRDVLYHLATLPSEAETVQTVRQAYDLETLLPPAAPPVSPMLGVLYSATAAFGRLLAGDAAAEDDCHRALTTLISDAARQGAMDQGRLLELLHESLGWLARTTEAVPAREGDPLTQEMKNTLGVLARSLGQAGENAAELQRQADLLAARLAELEFSLTAASETLAPPPATPATPTDTPTLVAQAQSWFEQIETGLQASLHRPLQRHALESLSGPIVELDRALAALGADDARRLLANCGQGVRTLNDMGPEAEEAVFPALVRELSALSEALSSLAPREAAPTEPDDDLPIMADAVEDNLPAPADEVAAELAPEIATDREAEPEAPPVADTVVELSAAPTFLLAGGFSVQTAAAYQSTPSADTPVSAYSVIASAAAKLNGTDTARLVGDRLPSAAAPAADAKANANADTSPEAEANPDPLVTFLKDARERLGEMHARLKQWQAEPDPAEPVARLLELVRAVRAGAEKAGAPEVGARAQGTLAILAAEPPARVACEMAVGRLGEALDALAQPTQAPQAPQPAAEVPSVELPPAPPPDPHQLRLTRSLEDASEIAIAAVQMESEIKRLRDGLAELQQRARAMATQVQTLAGVTGPDAPVAAREALNLLTEGAQDLSVLQLSLARRVSTTEALLEAHARAQRELHQALMDLHNVPAERLAPRLQAVLVRLGKQAGVPVRLSFNANGVTVAPSMLETLSGLVETLLPQVAASAGEPSVIACDVDIRTQGHDLTVALGPVRDPAMLDLERIRSQLQALPLRPGTHLECVPRSGAGHTLRLFLPQPALAVPVVLLRAGRVRAAVPEHLILHRQLVEGPALTQLRETGHFVWQGETFAVRELGELFSAPAFPERRAQLLLTRSNKLRLALVSEAGTESRDVVLKSGPTALGRVPGVIGTTVLDDQQVVVLINPLTVAECKPAPDTPTGERIQAPRLLLVDDSPTARKLGRSVLEAAGFEVVTAPSGGQGLECTRDVNFAAVLIDSDMPGMDGLELARRLRAEAGLASVPIIMLSSRMSTDHREAARMAGVDQYLRKPYEPSQLVAAVQAGLNQRGSVELTGLTGLTGERQLVV